MEYEIKYPEIPEFQHLPSDFLTDDEILALKELVQEMFRV